MRPSTPEDFWRRVDKSGDCWPWLGPKDRDGYGRLTYQGRRMHSAHRLSWKLANGPIPKGMCVCHRCDNPPCCNPAHLWLGTNQDNMDDKVSKGRHSYRSHVGVENPNSKLTEDEVLDIRAARAFGAAQKDIAKAYNLEVSVISRITTRASWKHLP